MIKVLNSIFLIFLGCFLFWLAEGLIAKDESSFTFTVTMQTIISTPGVLLIAIGLKELSCD